MYNKRVQIFLLMLSVLPPALFAGGTVTEVSIESSALGVSKNVVIYLPDSYGETDIRYPVIYITHGWGVTETAWTSPSLDVPGKADEMSLQAIVVMPDGDRGVYVNALTGVDYEACLNASPPYPNRNEPREEFCVRAPNYENYMLEDIIPYIDSHFRTISSREGRALSGESAGGLAAMHLAIRHRNIFSSVASHSGGVSMLLDIDSGMQMSAMIHRRGFEEWEAMFGLDIDRWRQYDPYSLLDTLEEGELAIYLDCGTEDEFGFFPMAQVFQARLAELGITHSWEWQEGGRHNDAQFGSRISHSLQFHEDHFFRAGIYPGQMK